jgi:hypothetical protein
LVLRRAFSRVGQRAGWVSARRDPLKARTYMKFRTETADPSAVKRMMGVVRGGLWLSLN